jgi:metallopeptidase MepB
MLKQGFTTSSQERHYPSAALIMNLPSPTSTKPSLLAHSDLRRLFHELGHGMHNLLSKTQYARFHGTSVDKDFVEAPSMLFENFLWTTQHMQDISCHYSHLSPVFMETWRAEQIAKGESTEAMAKQISVEVVEKLVETKHFNDSLRTMVILFQSLFDMRVHSQTDHDLSAEELGTLYNTLRAEVTGFVGVEALSNDDGGCHGFSAFRSIMGNYDAGYYTYLL